MKYQLNVDLELFNQEETEKLAESVDLVKKRKLNELKKLSKFAVSNETIKEINKISNELIVLLEQIDSLNSYYQYNLWSK